MAARIVLDLFAGPGGWTTGYRRAGGTLPVVGIEHDLVACRTAAAAGHDRVCADVATYPAVVFASRVDGLIASPPCQGWSSAGHRRGMLDRAAVFARITAFARGRRPADVAWQEERSPPTSVSTPRVSASVLGDCCSESARQARMSDADAA